MTVSQVSFSCLLSIVHTSSRQLFSFIRSPRCISLPQPPLLYSSPHPPSFQQPAKVVFLSVSVFQPVFPADSTCSYPRQISTASFPSSSDPSGPNEPANDTCSEDFPRRTFVPGAKQHRPLESRQLPRLCAPCQGHSQRSAFFLSVSWTGGMGRSLQRLDETTGLDSTSCNKCLEIASRLQFEARIGDGAAGWATTARLLHKYPAFVPATRRYGS